ncbi:Flp pilus assembly protein CpaB [Vibrio sp. ABG19]|uniref:Flp pilus assembly protein CpaB n=1 Tax=Vibrio sp. ABG19 TaxID=2817385 RepID=UPI00249F09AC|nr:Flp pilus assembly protein CpaB [Vibrio sp. ABG19]WGY47377.1 Flp pilus assembly protein CpaB [Vibrio sp. ABG19]
MNLTHNKVKALKLASVVLFAIALIVVLIGLLTAPKTKPQPSQSPAPLYSAWVFDQPLEQGTMIASEMLRQVNTPQHSQRYIQNKQFVVGRRLNQSVDVGDYVTDDLLAPDRPVIDDLPPHHRAIAIKAGEVLTVGGYIQPGDYVDVMLLLKPNRESGTSTTSRKIASSLKVLAVGDLQLGTDSDNRENHAKSVVLSVREDLAPTILLADSSGELRLAAVGSQELAFEQPSKDLDPALLLQTVSLTRQPSATTTNTLVAELKQFEPPKKETKKSSKPDPARQRVATRTRYVEVIQGNERSVVKVPQQ